MAQKKKFAGNHITKASRTLVVRVPTSVHAAYVKEAKSAGVDMADLVREDLARGLKRREYEILPETAKACGL